MPPEQEAVLLPGHQRLTYGRLLRETGKLSARLHESGLREGHHAGMLIENRELFVRVLLGILGLGACPVPLPAHGTTDEVEQMIHRGGIDVLFLGEEAGNEDKALLNSLSDRVLVRVRMKRGTVSFEPDGSFPGQKKRDRCPGSLMMFTSGTSGTPKPVVLSDRNIEMSAFGSALRLGAHKGDRWLSPLPLHHMGGLAPVLRSILYGTTVIPVSPDPADIPRLVERFEPTAISLVPVMLREILSGEENSWGDSLRFALLGGAAASPDLVRSAVKRGIPVCPTYGTTETTSQVATARPGEATEHPETTGRPIRFASVTIRDEDGAVVPPGGEGEIVVEGPIVAEGYYGNGDKERHQFRGNQFWTGDQGGLDEEGRLKVTGRINRRIVTGGENVDPVAVEHVLESHQAIDRACVVGVEDKRWGERVVAAVETTGTVSQDALEEFCSNHLSSHRRPRSFRIMQRLPETDSGTIDLSQVKRMFSTIDHE